MRPQRVNYNLWSDSQGAMADWIRRTRSAHPIPSEGYLPGELFFETEDEVLADDLEVERADFYRELEEEDRS